MNIKYVQNAVKKKVGSRNAWFQDFTDQPLQCNRCINKEIK